MAAWSDVYTLSIICFFVCDSSLFLLYFLQLLQSARVWLDAGEDIPVDLMAKILKLQLLQVKSSDQHRREAEQMELGSRIFEGVANLIYDCLQWRREHQHYRNKLQLLHVPSISGSGYKPAELHHSLYRKSHFLVFRGFLSAQVDISYYNSLLDLIPPEACSVPLMLHCMLEQVVISTEQLAVPDHSEEPEADENMWLDGQLVRYMLQSFLPQIPTEEEKRHLISDLLTAVQEDEDKKNCTKSTEKNCNMWTLQVEHGFNPAEVEASMMRLSPVLQGIQSVEKRRKSTSRWTSVQQQLQHFCTDETVTWAEVELLFHLSVFEAMALTTVDERGMLRDAVRPVGRLEATQQQSQTFIPWDDPEAFAKQQLFNLKSKVHLNRLLFSKGSDEMQQNVCISIKSSLSLCSAENFLHSFMYKNIIFVDIV
uniref:Uncharacterized protein n=1 Tax=Oryzias latipes TaxID=8090 RepID=A0A3P9HQK0_ORYLA